MHYTFEACFCAVHAKSQKDKSFNSCVFHTPLLWFSWIQHRGIFTFAIPTASMHCPPWKMKQRVSCIQCYGSEYHASASHVHSYLLLYRTPNPLPFWTRCRFKSSEYTVMFTIWSSRADHVSIPLLLAYQEFFFPFTHPSMNKGINHNRVAISAIFSENLNRRNVLPCHIKRVHWVDVMTQASGDNIHMQGRQCPVVPESMWWMILAMNAPFKI